MNPGPAQRSRDALRPCRPGCGDVILAAMRKFNTEGPVVATDHYCIPPLERVNLDEILALIDDKRYFVLHAPRQTGKTSVPAGVARSAE